MKEIENNDSQQESFLEQCRSGFGTKTDRKNQKHFVFLMFIWAVLFIASTWLLKGEYFDGILSYIVAILPTVVGLVGVLSYVKFLRETDELIRKIELEGLAIGFGVGVLCILGYPLLVMVGLPPISIQTAGAVMLFAWVFGQIIARRRYR